MDYSEQRRFPRRSMEAPFGILKHGEYEVFRSYEIGEKGVGVYGDQEAKLGDQVVVCFYINQGNFIVCRGIVRFCRPEKLKFKLGIEFTNIKFEDRRIIRDYIADRGDATTHFIKKLSLNN